MNSSQSTPLILDNHALYSKMRFYMWQHRRATRMGEIAPNSKKLPLWSSSQPQCRKVLARCSVGSSLEGYQFRSLHGESTDPGDQVSLWGVRVWECHTKRRGP